MIYLELFLEFFKIGLFTFGGGYAMIPVIRETVLSNGWLNEYSLMNYIAVAESTPGPIAVNMATFVGSSQGGILGALVATLGVVLPSFIIILLIASVISGFMKYKDVESFMSGVRPCVVAMIFATGAILGMSVLFGFSSAGDAMAPDMRAIAIFGVLTAVHLLWKRLRKKKPSPIVMILISAALGAVAYGIV